MKCYKSVQNVELNGNIEMMNSSAGQAGAEILEWSGRVEMLR